jgi:hypothetical protein
MPDPNESASRDERKTDPAPLDPWSHIYERLSALETEITEAKSAALQAVRNSQLSVDTIERIEVGFLDVKKGVQQAIDAAQSSADSAQQSSLKFDRLSERFEQLRREHLQNHPERESLVPASLLKR